jgi:hypothetical protein
MNNPPSSVKTCRQMLGWTPSSVRKDGQPRVINKYPATCECCGDALAPGEGIVGSKDRETGRARWICGPGRFQRR